MKTFVAYLFAGIFLQSAVFAQNIGISFDLQALQGLYHWEATAERMLATPAWSDQAQPIPLPLDKACQLARKWLNQNELNRFELDKVELLRYPPGYIGTRGEELRKRFYYRLDYHTKQMELIYVYVLLDGTSSRTQSDTFGAEGLPRF